MLSSNTRSMRLLSVRSRASSPLIASTTLTPSCRTIWTRARVRRLIAPCMSGTKTNWGLVCLGVPKLECSCLGLWICGHRNDEHHDGTRRNRHAWSLALAMADDRCRPGTDHDSRPRVVRLKCAEDPERRLVPAGDRDRRVHDHDHLARKTPVGAGAAGKPGGATCLLPGHLPRGPGSPRLRHRSLPHHTDRKRAADPAEQP